MKPSRIILPIVLFFLFSCASTQKSEQKDARLYNNRGIACGEKSQYDQAISDFNKAIQINSLEAEGCNNLAWLFAMAKSPGFRNGKKAVEIGIKACELSGWRNAEYLDTLAAAYATVGDFENAVKWQEKDLQFFEERKKNEAKQRLNFYRGGKPWPADYVRYARFLPACFLFEE